jgi:hypothetical protein
MQVFTERKPVRSRRVAQGGAETSSGRVNCGLSVQVNGVVIPASMCMLPSGELVLINMFGDVYVGNATGIANVINTEYGAGDVTVCSEDGCTPLQGVEQPVFAKLASIIHILVDGSPVSEVTLRRYDGYFIVLRTYMEPVAIPENQLAETLANWLCGNRQCTVTLVECPPDAPCRRIQL